MWNEANGKSQWLRENMIAAGAQGDQRVRVARYVKYRWSLEQAGPKSELYQRKRTALERRG